MSSRTKLLIGVGVLVAVVVAWFFLYYSPKGDDLSALDGELDEAVAEESELETQLELLERLEAEAPAREAALRRLNAAVPVQPDLDVFILEANEIADLSGVDWLSVSPTPPAAGGTAGVSVISMTIEIQGGFFQVLDYINRLEDIERLVITDSLSISTGGGEGDDGKGADSGSGAPTLSVTLTSRMYTRADPSLGDAATTDGGTAPSDEPAPEEPTPDEPRPDTPPTGADTEPVV